MVKVARNGALPATKTELFEKACRLMASEENPKHRRASASRVSDDEILCAAGFLCATILLAGLTGFAGDATDRGDDFPPLTEISGSPEEFRAAVGSRLFRWEGGRPVPVHRTIAEFLAARYLRGRIVGGLPLDRVLRLITGHDGGTLGELRGLFAWLTSLTPQHAEALARRDPAAVVFYGDPEPLPPAVKRSILAGLETLADRHPLFFYERPSVQAYGALSDTTLIPEFQAVLDDPGRPRYFRLTVLAILAYGHPLPELKEDLHRIVYDRDSPQGIRQLGLKALIHVTFDKAELLNLLQDLCSGGLLDEDQNQRASLLESLYPELLKPWEIARYLTVPKPNFYGDYRRFVREVLSPRTPDEGVPDLLDALSDAAIWKGSRRRRSLQGGDWQKLAGTLLKRGLGLQGDSVPVERLWSWLKIGRDSGFTALAAGDHAAVQHWFNARPQLVMKMYQWWVMEGVVKEDISSTGGFWEALCNPNLPPDLWRWQLAQAEVLGAEERGVELFRSAFFLLQKCTIPDAIGELRAWVGQHPGFEEAFNRLLQVATLFSQPYSDPVGEERDRREEEQEYATRATTIVFLKERIHSVRMGEDKDILDALASRILEFDNSGQGHSDLTALREEFGQEIASAAAEGFRAILERADWASPSEIGEQSANREALSGGLGLLVGVLFAQEEVLPSLDQSPGLRAALAFEFTQGVYEPSRWFEAIVQREPAAAAKVVEAAWRPLLKTHPKDVQHLIHMDGDPVLRLIAREIGQRLLEDYPQANPRLLAQLMRAALVGTSREKLAPLVEREIGQELTRDQHVLWLALALLVIPKEGVKQLESFLAGGDSVEKAQCLVGYLKDLERHRRSLALQLLSA